MKAIVVTDEAVGTAGMTLVERPEPEPAINAATSTTNCGPVSPRARCLSKTRAV